MDHVELQRRVEIMEEHLRQLRDVPVRLVAVELQIRQLRGDIETGFSDVRREMRTLNDETRARMRVLHEEVISRLALLQEGLRSRRRPPRR